MEILPIPPIPPAGPLTQDAPVPNPDARAPAEAESRDPRVTIRRYGRDDFNTSRGFAPGSRMITQEDDRKLFQSPGLSVHVPLGK